jgi:hypothetical protein
MNFEQNVGLSDPMITSYTLISVVLFGATATNTATKLASFRLFTCLFILLTLTGIYPGKYKAYYIKWRIAFDVELAKNGVLWECVCWRVDVGKWHHIVAGDGDHLS